MYRVTIYWNGMKEIETMNRDDANRFYRFIQGKAQQQENAFFWCIPKQNKKLYVARNSITHFEVEDV